jgi:hypothetical protein
MISDGIVNQIPVMTKAKQSRTKDQAGKTNVKPA